MAGDDEDNNNKYKHRGYEILSFMYIIMKGETVIIKWDILEPILDGFLDESKISLFHQELAFRLHHVQCMQENAKIALARII